MKISPKTICTAFQPSTLQPSINRCKTLAGKKKKKSTVPQSHIDSFATLPTHYTNWSRSFIASINFNKIHKQKNCFKQVPKRQKSHTLVLPKAISKATYYSGTTKIFFFHFQKQIMFSE